MHNDPLDDSLEVPVPENPARSVDQVEQAMANVERAMATLDEIAARSGGRGGEAAAAEIRAAVSPQRFPV